ncbi:MAG TPA: amidohydrolase family protein [Acidimicrobiales bacterium]
MSLLVVGGEVGGRAGVDVRVEGGVVTEVGAGLRPGRGDDVVEAGGGAVLPGLHDHHVHLRALAAARASVAVGPPGVRDRAAFADRLRRAVAAAPPGGWVRATGYHESVAGPLDRHALDAVVGDAPVRVQHRTGTLWVLSSAAVRLAGVDACPLPGVERDGAGRPTGRLWRMDGWLRAAVPAVPADLAAVGREAAARGVTGLTDADPERAPGAVEALAALPQRVHVMGPLGLAVPDGTRLTVGPVKVILHDEELPAPADLAATVAAAHAEGRPIAVHCVTRVQLVVAALALDEAGARPGDRIEHASVAPDDLLPHLRRLGVTVVTQPNLVAERGDEYRREVDPDDVPHLYRCRSLVMAGIPTAGSTDAPFGGADPWAAVAAAVDRRTASGAVLGEAERLDPAAALALFLGPAEAPAEPRRVEPGAPGDLCVLAAPLAEVLADPAAARVAATAVAGEVVHRRDR